MRPVRKEPPRPTLAPASPSRAAMPAQALTALVVMVTAGLLAWHPLEDLDIWFHDRAGADFLATGPLPAQNHYSFTEPTHAWLNHEWLFQLLAHTTGPHGHATESGVAGWNLLRLILTAAIAAVLLLGDGGLRRLRGNGSALAAAWHGPLLLGSLGLLWPRLLLRPELVSYLALVLLVRWTEDLRTDLSDGGKAVLRARDLVDPRQAAGRLFWLTLAWAQCHGFSAAAPLVVAIGLLAPAPGHALRAPDRRTLRAAGLVTAATLAALVATPNGLQGLAFPLRALGQFGEGVNLRNTIAELAPLLRTPDMLGLTTIVFKASLGVGAVLVVGGWRRIGVLRIVLWLAMAAATFSSQRALGPYAIAFALLGLRGSLPRFLPARFGSRGADALALTGAVVALVTAVLWGAAVTSDRFYLAEGVTRRFGNGLATAQYPVEAAEKLTGRPGTQVFANLGASGLLLGTTRVLPFVDGRTEAYSPALWREYLDIKSAGDRALSLLDARRVDAVCLANPGGPFAALAADLIASHRWDLAGAEGAGLLFVRETIPFGPDAAGRLEAAKRTVLLEAADRQQAAARSAPLSPARAADGLVAAATLYRLAGADDQRRACLAAAVARSPRHALARHNYGNQLLADGRTEAALAEFRAAAAANRRLAGPRLNAGVCLMKLKQAGEAARWFTAATRIDPRSVEAWANLAVARNATGDRTGALSAIDRALALSPGNARLSGLRDSLRRGAPAQ
jgi:tetratricopeptide (TPR) repeat protein